MEFRLPVHGLLLSPIGFEVKRGFRRQQAALSYSDIQRYGKVGSRQDLASALKHGLASNCIQQLEPGHFDPNAGRTSRAAIYGLKWASDARDCESTGSISLPVNNPSVTSTSSRSVQEGQSKNRTGCDSETVPADRFKNPYRHTNNTSK